MREATEEVLRRLREGSEGADWIDLRHEALEMEDVQALMAALKESKTVEVVNLEGNDLDETAAEAIAEMLSENASVRELVLGSGFGENCVGDKGCEYLAAALRRNKTLEVLNLSNNGIGDAGVESIAKALKANRSLQALFLSFNAIGDAGAKHLADALRSNHKLHVLDLSSNAIKDAGGAALADALDAGGKSSGSLEELHLSDNDLGAATEARVRKHVKTADERQVAFDNDGATTVGGSVAGSPLLLRLQASSGRPTSMLRHLGRSSQRMHQQNGPRDSKRQSWTRRQLSKGFAEVTKAAKRLSQSYAA